MPIAPAVVARLQGVALGIRVLDVRRPLVQACAAQEELLPRTLRLEMVGPLLLAISGVQALLARLQILLVVRTGRVRMRFQAALLFARGQMFLAAQPFYGPMRNALEGLVIIQASLRRRRIEVTNAVGLLLLDLLEGKDGLVDDRRDLPVVHAHGKQMFDFALTALELLERTLALLNLFAHLCDLGLTAGGQLLENHARVLVNNSGSIDNLGHKRFSLKT